MRASLRLMPLVIVVVVGLGGPAHRLSAADDPFAEPRKRLLHGNYEEARTGYEDAAKADPGRAAVGVSQTFRAVGEYEKALATLTAVVKDHPKHADLLAARADLLYALGRWDDADKDITAALAANDAQLFARWTKARILRDRGQLDDADQAFRWVVRYYTARSNADNDIKDADELVIVAACGAENARWHNLSRQFAFILNEVLADALKFDADVWTAEQMAGEMLLEKYNRPDAVDAFDNALKINPKAVEPLVGKGRTAIGKFDVKEAEQFAEQALKLNPRHPAALRLMADCELIANQWPEAEKHLLTARTVNPRDEATLARLAAVYRLQDRDDDFASVVETVRGFDSKPGVFYFELADCLEERKRYADAEAFYRQAADLRPKLAGPQTGLGMLFLRLGREKEGGEILAKAFEADPFNVRVANSLKVLRHLDEYETILTPHYELRFNPETDKVLAAFLAEYLEETHVMLKGQFNYEPPGRVLIEVFSTHEMFSGRTVGLPDLHTIGACTGKVVAMASTHAKGVRKPFNWGRVIRHELTHIFNLAQTDFLCPHWLTEGLAVRNEEMARPRDWSSILRDRMDSDTLFNLDTVMLGFVRPKSPDEWTLAYCQSQLYVEYMVKTHGEECVGKLLEAYGRGLDTAAALKAAIGVDKAAFEKGYRAYLDDLMKPHRRTKKAPDEKQLTFAELEAEHEKNPDDLEITARLADQYYRRNQASDARKLAEAVLAESPGHPVASVVKARLLSRAGSDDEATDVLEAARKANPDEPKLLLALARYHTDAEDYSAAAAVLEHGREIAPLDGNWLEQLARIYKMTGDNDKLASVLKEVVASDPDELDGRILLANASLKAGNTADAERYALDAIRIDVTSEEARTALLAALKAGGKTDEATKVSERFGE